MVQHAMASEDKQARRKTILNAASALFIAGNGSLPAAAQVAAAAGLAKGTVYLYFRTKEEIFIALLLEGLLTLFGEIEATFKNTKGRRRDRIAAFLKTYVDYLHQHPELLRLDALGYGVLEKNLEPAKLRDFKFTFAAKLTETGIIVEHALRLSPGHGIRLLMRTFALTRGLWQFSHPCQELKNRKDEPALAPLYPDFNKELTEALTEYWRGALVVCVKQNADYSRCGVRA